MMKKRAFVVSMGLSAVLGVGACSIDSDLISDLVGDLTGGLNFGSDDLSVALACPDLSAQDIELAQSGMQTWRNEGMSYSAAATQMADRCEGMPGFSSLEACIACGNAIVSDVYSGF